MLLQSVPDPTTTAVPETTTTVPCSATSNTCSFQEVATHASSASLSVIVTLLIAGLILQTWALVRRN